MSLPILEQVRIASPCAAPWDEMKGDDRMRRCAQCDRDVFNLSALTRAQAEAFLLSRTGACIRLFKRFDGTIITQDCPVGWRKVRRAIRRRVMLASIFLLGLVGLGAGGVASSVTTCHDSISDGDAFDSPLLQQILALVKGQPTPVATPMGQMIIGRMPLRTPTPTPRPTP